MAQKFYVPFMVSGQSVSREAQKWYVPVEVNAQWLSKAVIKAYVGNANNESRLFFGSSITPEYNHHQRPSAYYMPNVSYNLNKLNMEDTLNIALDTCAYASENNPSVLAVVEKFRGVVDTIWNYASSLLTDEDTIDIQISFSNMGYPYLYLNFAKTNVSNVQITTPMTGQPPESRVVGTNPITLRYMLSNAISVSCKQVMVEYDVSSDRFSYSNTTSSLYLYAIGGYALSFQAGTNPPDYQTLSYQANNLGSTQEDSPINPNEDFFMKINCITGTVVEGVNSSGNNSNYYLVDDAYNYYGIAYQKNTSYVEKTSNGLLIKSSCITIPNQFFFKGIGDYIFKFGNIDIPASTGTLFTKYLLYCQFTYNNYNRYFALVYYSESTWRGDAGWYILNYDKTTDNDQWTYITSNKDIFNNSLVQLHFDSPTNKALDIYVGGVKIKGNISCSAIYDFVVPVYIGNINNQQSTSIMLEKMAISRSKEIVLYI